MNRIHKSIWNEKTGTFVAVSETTRSRGKKSSETNSGGQNATIKLLCASMMLAYGSIALALPIGGQVSAGSAAISAGAGKMTVTQSSQNAAINWQSFNIGSNESVNFVQPNSSSVALNRVLGNDPSSILGSLTANGQVFLINPNGILFGKGAQVNVGGLVASTLNLSDADFMTGRYRFSGKGGSIGNQGSITANGGYVALLGGKVSNEGVITAQLGTVALAGGNAMTLDMAGDGLLSIAVNQGAVNAEVRNGGLIRADGGTVLMTTRAADTLLNDVVNNSGIIEAQTIDAHGGQISLLGSADSGTVNVSGTLDASAPNGGNGGKIETSASHVSVSKDAKITTLASNGLNGSWLIDPVDFTIASSGGDITGSSLGTLLGSNNVTIQTSTGTNTSTNLYGTTGTNGDIFVNDQVSWSANNTLTLNAYRNIYIDKSVTSSGTSGKLSLLYGQGAANGTISGTAATYTINAPVNLAAGANFSTQLGSTGTVVNYTVITSLGAAGSATGTDLQGMSTAGNYALGANIDASGTSTWNGNAGFNPVGTSGTNFTGNFEGLGHTISNLTINRSGTSHVGLFGYGNTSGVIRDVGLVGGSFTGNQSVGPLVGYLNNGAIVNSFATGSVSGSSYVGGLVGNMLGGSVSNSFATGSVTASGSSGAGGLVGIMYQVGTAPSVSNSYATGKVTATGGAGALVGPNTGGTVSNSFYETGINGSMTGISGTADAAGKVYGMSASAMQNQANFTTATSANGSVNPGWDFTNATWGFGNVASGISNTNGNLPVLCTFGGCVVSVVVYVDPVTGASVYGSAPSFSYMLVNSSGSAYTLSNASVTGTATYNGPTAASNVGSYTVTYSSGLSLTGANASSYALKAYQPPSTNWTVSPATLTTQLSGSKTYGQSWSVTQASLQYISGLQNGDFFGIIMNNVTSAGSSTTAAVGIYPMKGAALFPLNNGSHASNYNLSCVNCVLTVNPAPLTVTASNASKTYGQTPTLTGFSSTGLQNGETIGSVTETSAGTSVAASVSAGPYAITPSAATGGTFNPANYSIAYNTGSLTVNPAPLSITANDYTKTYDGNAYSGGNGVTYSGFVNNETSSVLSGTLTYGGASQGATAVGNYSITVGGQKAASGNYTITYHPGALTINRNLLIVTATLFPAPTAVGGEGVVVSYTQDGVTAYQNVFVTLDPNGNQVVNTWTYTIDASGTVVTRGYSTIGVQQAMTDVVISDLFHDGVTTTEDDIALDMGAAANAAASGTIDGVAARTWQETEAAAIGAVVQGAVPSEIQGLLTVGE